MMKTSPTDNHEFARHRCELLRVGAKVAVERDLDRPFREIGEIGDMLACLPGAVGYYEGWPGSTLAQIREIGRIEMVTVITRTELSVPFEQLVEKIVQRVPRRAWYRTRGNRDSADHSSLSDPGRRYRRARRVLARQGLPATDQNIANLLSISPRRARELWRAHELQYPRHCDLAWVCYDPHTRLGRFTRTSVHSDTADGEDLMKRYGLMIPEIDGTGNDE